MSLYQDAAGTVPALLPGDPVGKITRAAGTVDASQATQASKPTLARWPKGGRRNLLIRTVAPSLTDWSRLNMVGEDSGIYGTNAAMEMATTTAQERYIQQSIPVEAGVDMACAVEYKPVGADRWIWLRTSGITNAPYMIVTPDGSISSEYGSINSRSAVLLPDGFVRIEMQFTTQSAGNLLFRLQMRSSEGQNAIGDPGKGILFRNLQLEYGTQFTAPQRVGTMNDVTEEGVPSVWHLYNDGGDSMPVVLPSGTYGIAWVDALGDVSTETVTSDGSTGIDLLKTTRMADVLIRQGALNPVEIQEITAYWEARYK